MLTHQIHVDNIKCGGCEKSILKGLRTIGGVGEVVIDAAQQQIQITAPDVSRDVLVAKLKAMGYPEHGSVHGLEAGLANAKSFVSCAIGRVA